MHIWRWLSRMSSTQKSAFIRSSLRGVNEHEVAFLINYMDTEAYLTRFADIEMVAKNILRRAEEVEDNFLKSVAHEALGRVFFEKGMFPAALAQFEDALSNYLSTGIKNPDYDETCAKLNAWIGLSALRTGDYKRSASAFRNAIDILLRLDKNRSILGELKALLGDALSYVSPEEAVQEFEEAHELMKESPSPLFISNGMKLFASLVFRKYYNEAASILSDISENLLRAISGMNLTVYQSFRKIYRNAFVKALKFINIENPRTIQDFLYGVEGIKGIYFIFRYFLKPIFKLKDLENYNQAIIIASKLNNPRYLEDMLERKKRLLRMYDVGGLSPYKLRNLYGFASKTIRFDALIQRARLGFRNILILSFTKLNVPNQYLLIALEYPLGAIALVKRLNIDVEEILASKEQGIEGMIKELQYLLPQEIIERLNEYDENDLVIVSPDGILHEVPWEAIPLNGEYPFLSLATNVLRVPTLHQLIFWNTTNLYYSSEKIAILEIPKERDKLRHAVRKYLKKRGYRVFSGLSDSIRLMMSEYVDFLYYAVEPFSISADEQFLRFGNSFLAITDIEKLDLSGGIVVLDLSNSVDIIEDEIGYHSAPIAFQIAGFRSILTINGKLSEKDRDYFINSLVEDQYANIITEWLLAFRRKLFTSNKNWWYQIVLYGDPHIRI